MNFPPGAESQLVDITAKFIDCVIYIWQDVSKLGPLIRNCIYNLCS
jgi:hypothetical protein